MTVNALETAHQTIKGGSGVAATAAAMSVSTTHLTDVLQGRRRLTPPVAVALAAQTGQTAAQLMRANTDEQLLLNKNSIL